MFKLKEKMFKYKYSKSILLIKNKKDMRAFALSLEHIKIKINLEDIWYDNKFDERSRQRNNNRGR